MALGTGVSWEKEHAAFRLPHVVFRPSAEGGKWDNRFSVPHFDFEYIAEEVEHE
jgi:hypothetical protein